MMMLMLSSEVVALMRAHLEAGYPHEACGILVGDVTYEAGRPAVKRALDLVPVPNVWDVESENEGQRNRYLIAPDDVARADREASKRGLDIIGFFHSHPDHPARPSETDREYAWPNISFVILSIRRGHAVDMRSWVLRDDRSAFDEEFIGQA
jgi:proteasome lid subunit RPN8/RPN11